MAPLTLDIIPGYTDLSDVPLSADDPAFGVHVEEISANAAFGMARVEVFQGLYFNGDTVPLPLSGIDGYAYERKELLYAYNIAVSTNKDSGWIQIGSGSLWFTNWFVDQNTGQVFSAEWYRNNGSGGTRTETNDGQIIVYTIAQRQRTNLIQSATPPFNTVNPAWIADDAPWKEELDQGLNRNAKFCVTNKEVFYCGEYVDGEQVPLSAVVSPADSYPYGYTECKFMAFWRWTTIGTKFTQPSEDDAFLGPFAWDIDATGHVSVYEERLDNDGGDHVAAGFGRVMVIAFCTRSATPATAPLANAFSELDEGFFTPGNTLRASNVLKIKKNIDEAILTPEWFGVTEYANGATIPLPVSPVDGYTYARNELTYVWSWNAVRPGTGSAVRIPVFYGGITQSTGLVTLAVWRLTDHYVDDDNTLGRMKVLIVARRQQHAPATVDTSTAGNPPSDVATALVGAPIPIAVNGVASAEVTNFNDSTPAAPAGMTNIKWQQGTVTSPCEVSAYVDLEMPIFVGGETATGVVDGANTAFDLQYAPLVVTPILGSGDIDNGWLILQQDNQLLNPNLTGTDPTGVGFTLRGAHIDCTHPPTKSLVAWYIRRPTGNAAVAGVKAHFTENDPTAV